MAECYRTENIKALISDIGEASRSYNTVEAINSVMSQCEFHRNTKS